MEHPPLRLVYLSGAALEAGVEEHEVDGVPVRVSAAAKTVADCFKFLNRKAVVADDEAVFVTSANLTEAALDRNIEMGLLVRDRALAITVTTHFRGLIERELLFPLPTE